MDTKLRAIFPTLVKDKVDALSLHIRSIYWACLVHVYIPIIASDMKVVFIQKPGKPTYMGPKNFRPISNKKAGNISNFVNKR